MVDFPSSYVRLPVTGNYFVWSQELAKHGLPRGCAEHNLLLMMQAGLVVVGDEAEASASKSYVTLGPTKKGPHKNPTLFRGFNGK